MASLGLLAPLPVPSARLCAWSMDFITDLPLSGRFNALFTVVDRLTKFTVLVPYLVGDGALSARQVA